jgi:hypothetical protein
VVGGAGRGRAEPVEVGRRGVGAAGSEAAGPDADDGVGVGSQTARSESGPSPRGRGRRRVEVGLVRGRRRGVGVGAEAGLTPRGRRSAESNRSCSSGGSRGGEVPWFWDFLGLQQEPTRECLYEMQHEADPKELD